MVTLILGLPAGSEWALLIIVALLIFGGSRLAGVGRGAGQAIREFKEETQSLKKPEPTEIPPQPAPGSALVPPATSVPADVVRDVTDPGAGA